MWAPENAETAATRRYAAARLGGDLGLPLADSLIYATAQSGGATLWTQDEHFSGLAGVKYFPA
jgi:predicted nucleic acid-binding protein